MELRWRKATIALLSLLLLLPGLHASAQTVTSITFPNPYLNYDFINDTLVVDSTYYRLVINTTNGVIQTLTFKLDKEYNLYPEGVPPLALAYASSETVTEENLNLTLVEFGNVTVKDYGHGVIAIVFSQPKTEGFTGTLTMILDYTKPYIDLVIEAPAGTLAIVAAANETMADSWALAYSSFQGDTLNVFTTTELGGASVAGSFDAAVMAGIVVENDTNVLRYVYGYSAIPGYRGPDFIGMFNKSMIWITGYDATVDTRSLGAIFYLVGDSTVGLRVSIFKYDPYAVLAANLLRPIEGLYDGVVNDVKPILYFTRFTEVLNTTIDNLRSQLEQLREENNNLTKQLEELQGCESYWKTELQKTQMDLDRIQTQLQKMGAVSIGAFLAGVILGVAGGVYVFEGIRSARRKR